MPIVFLRRAVIDEAVDGFMRDDAAALCAGELPGDLFRRPALQEAGVDIGLQVRITRELVAIIPMPAPFRKLLGTGRFIPPGPDFGGWTITLQFPADGAGGAAEDFGNGAK